MPVADVFDVIGDNEQQIETRKKRVWKSDVLVGILVDVVLSIDRVGCSHDRAASVQRGVNSSLCDCNSLLLHDFVNRHTVDIGHLVEFVNTDDAAVTEVLDLAIKVGSVLLDSGTGAIDTQTQIRFVAGMFGVERADVDVTYNTIMVSARRGAGSFRAPRMASTEEVAAVTTRAVTPTTTAERPAIPASRKNPRRSRARCASVPVPASPAASPSSAFAAEPREQPVHRPGIGVERGIGRRLVPGHRMRLARSAQ